jgi:hypothetical protein
MPPWTPAKTSPGSFSRISNGVYSYWRWDPSLEFNGEPGNFANVGETDLNVVFETSAFSGEG